MKASLAPTASATYVQVGLEAMLLLPSPSALVSVHAPAPAASFLLLTPHASMLLLLALIRRAEGALD